MIKGTASRVVSALATALVVIALTASAEAAGKLRVGNEADFPPFSFKDSAGNVKGFDVDVTDYLCKFMGSDCEIVVQEWSGIIPALYAGKYDVIISSMTINPDRKKKVLFSKPYYLSPYAFVAKKHVNFEITRAGLKGRTLCMFKNSTPLKWLKAEFGDTITIKYYDGAEAIKFDLIADRCEAWLETMPSIFGTIMDTPEGKDFHFVGPQLTDPKWFGEGVGIATRLDNKDLIAKINAGIDAMYADGTFKKINDTYFPFNLGAQ
jgi:arginine/ornithine transport system substrate-binding protein